jgi:5-methylcytosine-specific restriction endonuclease McrA
MLAIVATDTTFVRGRHGTEEAWIGKCLHCGGHLVIGLDGEPISRATIEHILPRSHGGTDELPNLALACARCNHQKGARHDNKRKGDPRLAEIVAKLAERRRARWREPDERGGESALGSSSRDD